MPMTRLDISIDDDELELTEDENNDDLILSSGVDAEFIFSETQGKTILNLLTEYFKKEGSV